MRLDFIDFPTGFELQGRIGHAEDAHLHRGCSAVLSEGALLCDCGAIAVEWARLGGEDWQRYIPVGLTDAASAALTAGADQNDESRAEARLPKSSV